MNKSVIIFLLCSLFVSLDGFSQYTIIPLDTFVTNGYPTVSYDIDNDSQDDITFHLEGYFDAVFMYADGHPDSIYFGYPVQTLGPAPFYNNLSINLASTTIGCYGWYALGGNMNNISYLHYYKKLSPTDSLFGYFITKPFEGSNTSSCIDDTLFIYKNVIANTINTPINPAEVCDFEITVSNTSCLPVCSGEISLSPIAGIAPYTYSWSNGETTTSIDSLCAGSYNVTVTDANGCVWDDSIYIDSVSAEFMFSLQGNTGAGCNTTILAIPTSGTLPFNYLWNTGATSSTLTGLCDAWYTLTLTDSNGCSFTDSILVDNDTSFATTANIVFPSNLSCEGPCTGSYDIWISGGIPPYTIQFTNGGTYTSNVAYFLADNICEGWSNYTITDSTGATVSNQIYINSLPDMTVNTIVTGTSCQNCNDGAVTILPSGGGAPYTFYLDGVISANGVYTGLSAGIYTICVQDNGQCNYCDTLTIPDPCTGSTLSISTTADTATCIGCNNGAVHGLASGGDAPYYYSIDGGITIQSIGDFYNLFAGNYTVCVTDSNNCTVCDTISVIEVPICSTYNLTISASSDSTSCQGCNDGTVTANAINAVGAAQYWMNGFPFNTSGIFNNVPPGNYQVCVMDSNGCMSCDSINVPFQNPCINSNLQLTLTTDSAYCSSCNDGAINATGIGGTPGYQYSLNAGPWQVGSSFISLPSGQYEVCVQDFNGCMFCDTITVYFGDPCLNTDLSISLIADSTLCSTCNDGVIYATSSGGGNPYLFSLNSGPWQTSGTFDNLTTGQYEVCVQDTYGCLSCDTITVNYGDPCLNSDLQINYTTDSSSCGSCSDGVIDAIASGGYGPYQYTLNNTVWVSSGMFTGLLPGNYQVCVEDNYMCYTCVDILVDSMWDCNSLNYSTTIQTTDVLCFGNCNGSAIITVDNSNGPFTINSSAQNISQLAPNQFVLDSLCSGNYSFELVDTNACSILDDFNISTPDSLYFTYNQSDTASCFNCNDAVVLLNLFGGNFPITVDWSSLGSMSNSQVATDLYGGTGLVCITDANNCEYCDSITVEYINDLGWVEDKNSVQMYPNPAKENITIESTVQINECIIYNASGKIISNFVPESNKFVLDLSDYSAGIYVFAVQSEHQIIKKKITVY
ncbi:T9SS type A sorting domain-containing protein [Paracrocinitomix mangrovi]|uniref:T9SS type A sorting domain-containing protein n=1 Tax=Paracrocinitomix mangrovi TaxID=2862509 RepID=UPI001C8D8071|nr:T9SS type A sorting domain-containing protein [Paracrocinitomix mangrovi]UKN01990.1 T9SS type A sorting domain-containing protein [Paracrocinitomix mangrovi]